MTSNLRSDRLREIAMLIGPADHNERPPSPDELRQAQRELQRIAGELDAQRVDLHHVRLLVAGIIEQPDGGR